MGFNSAFKGLKCYQNLSTGSQIIRCHVKICFCSIIPKTLDLKKKILCMQSIFLVALLVQKYDHCHKYFTSCAHDEGRKEGRISYKAFGFVSRF